MKADRINKGEALKHWAELEENQPLNMEAIPYKRRGSKYGFDGIRIDGTKAFIDAVLSRLKPLLAYENCNQRLELNYTEIICKESGQPTGSWVCYIRVHTRGGEAQIMNAMVSAMTGKQTLVSAGY